MLDNRGSQSRVWRVLLPGQRREKQTRHYSISLLSVFFPVLAKDKKEKVMSVLSKKKNTFIRIVGAPFVWANTAFQQTREDFYMDPFVQPSVGLLSTHVWFPNVDPFGSNLPLVL